jgi:small-conductance mechanosensitive channel
MLLEIPLIEDTSTYLQLARFLVTLIAGVAATRLLLMPATRKIVRKKGDREAIHSIENLVGVLGLFLTFTVALQAGNFGNLATIIGAIAAAVTVAVGFGMRDQVASLVGGIFIHLDNPFVRGDYIKMDEYEGVVREIKLRATVLNGKTSEKLVVPNGALVTNSVRNFTKGNRTKTSLEMSLEAPKQEAHSGILKEAAGEHEGVLSRPEPEIVLKGLEDGKVNAELHYWVRNSEDVEKVRSGVLEKYIQKGVEEGLISEEKEEE